MQLLYFVNFVPEVLEHSNLPETVISQFTKKVHRRVGVGDRLLDAGVLLRPPRCYRTT